MKHFLLSTISPVVFASLSAVHMTSQMPDTNTPFHLLIESPTAKELDLSPGKKPEKFDPKVLTDIIDNSQTIGIKFATKPDLKTLLSSDFLGEIESTKNPDTAVYIGTMPTLTGDDDNGDGETVVLAVGPQAQNVIDALEQIGNTTIVSKTLVKQFFHGIVSDGVTATTTSKPVAQSQRLEIAEA